MNTPDLLKIPLASIEVGSDRARELEPAWAEALAALIAAQGLLHPIIVRQMDGDAYRLVAGLHRLEAYRLLGLPSIPAYLSAAESDDAARLEEVMENLGRYDLNALDRCHHLYDLKQIHERKYPQAKHGGEPGNQHTGGKILTSDLGKGQPEVFGFTSYIAEKIVLSHSVISAAVKIWAGLSPASRRRLQGTVLGGKQTELKALSEETPKLQAQILDLILGEGHPEIQNVAGALAQLDRGEPVSPIEKQVQSVQTAFGKLAEPALDLVVSAHADRVIASLQRLGRL